MKHLRSSAFLWVASLLAVTAAVYYPALGSGFQLDDLNNLGGLWIVGDQGLLYYLFGGSAGTSGRPLSLLSFALQYASWPDHPFAFKAVNLAIHLCCGALVFLLMRRLARAFQEESGQSDAFAIGVAALWLLHPIQSTTVLYVVQRMTQLSALFTLLGLILYLRCREHCRASTDPHALLMTGIAVWGCTALAVLCKENGILLPLFAIVIEATLLAGSPMSAEWRRWNKVILWTPLAALLVYLAWTFDAVLASYATRPFTMSERLLTQPVVLLDYAWKMLLPVPGTFSIYHDDFPAARGLVSQPWVLLAASLAGTLVAAALITRRRLPVIAFGVLWFFAGHALESSHLNLELYFEHRNYLPSLGLFVVIAHLVFGAGRFLSRPAMAAAMLALYTAAIAAVTVFEASLWKDPLERHSRFLQRHPDSPRALTAFGNLLISTGRADEAERFYRRLSRERPADVFPRLKLAAIAACVRDRPMTEEEWRALIQAAHDSTGSDFGVVEELSLVVASTGEDDCPGIDSAQLARVVVTLALNPRFYRERAALHELAARLGVLMGDAGVAYHNIVESVHLAPNVPRQLLKLQILLALGKREEMQTALQSLKAQLEGSLRMRIAYGRALDRFEEAAAALTGALRGGAKTGEN
ncbi:MAG TPA: hypothetical protein VIC61_05185 [Gammaproteobacteria bacterium]